MSDWDKVVDSHSHVWHMYMAEINRQARTCKAACGHTLALGYRLRMGQQLTSQQLDDLGGHVEQAISCGSSLRNLIFGASKPKDKKLLDFWKARTQWIHNALGNPELPAIRNVATRNSMEHFDERMDTWAFDWASRSSDTSGWVGIFDWMMTSRDQSARSSPHSEYVRCYIADEAKFVIRDDEVHIPSLMEDATTVIRESQAVNAAHTTVWKTSGSAPIVVVPL